MGAGDGWKYSREKLKDLFELFVFFRVYLTE